MLVGIASVRLQIVVGVVVQTFTWVTPKLQETTHFKDHQWPGRVAALGTSCFLPATSLAFLIGFPFPAFGVSTSLLSPQPS